MSKPPAAAAYAGAGAGAAAASASAQSSAPTPIQPLPHPTTYSNQTTNINSNANTNGPLPPPIWPFLSNTFPLLLPSQLTQLPSTLPSTFPQQPASATIEHPFVALKGKKLSIQGEKRVRGLYITLIMKAGRLLELPNLTIATACVYWHRFFSLHSFLVYHPSLCAAGAIFLASKVEENNRRVRDIINVVHRVEFMRPILPTHMSTPTHPIHATSPSPASTSTGSSPGPTTRTIATTAKDEPLQVSQLFWDLKDEVLRFEQKLLRVLNFEMKIYHPHLYILHFARELECSEEVCRCAYYLANDSLRSTLCLQYPPNAIACACIYLSSEMMSESIRFHPVIMKETNSSTSHPSATTSAASASPYRSPHPSGVSSLSSSIGPSSGSVPSAAPSNSSASVTSLSGILSTSHSVEWWEYFGRVNQLEMEDITHQLLNILDDDAWYDNETMHLYDDPYNGASSASPIGVSLHDEFRRICEEEERLARIQAGYTPSHAQQREGDDGTNDEMNSSAQYGRPQFGSTTPTSSTHRRSAGNTPSAVYTPSQSHAYSYANSRTPNHSQTIEAYPSLNTKTTPISAPSSANSSQPHRIQLQSYPTQTQVQAQAYATQSTR